MCSTVQKVISDLLPFSHSFEDFVLMCKLVSNCLYQEWAVGTTNHRNQCTTLPITNYTQLTKNTKYNNW